MASVALRDLGRISIGCDGAHNVRAIYADLIRFSLIGVRTASHMTTQDLCNIVKKKTGIPKLSNALIIDAITSLTETEELSRNDESITVNNAQLKSEGENPYELILKRMTSKIEKKVGSFDDYQYQLIDSVLGKVLLRLFDEIGDGVEGLFAGSPHQSHQINIEKVVSNAFNEFSGSNINNMEKIKENFLQIMAELVEDGSKEVVDSFWRIGSSYVALRTLSSDPELTRLKRETIGNTTIFLDTNTIISLLCEGSASHFFTKSIFESSKSLEISFGILDITEEEFYQTLNGDTQRYQIANALNDFTSISMREIPKTFINYSHKYRDWFSFISEIAIEYKLFVQENPIKIWKTSSPIMEDDNLNLALHCIRQSGNPEKEKDARAIQHDAESIVIIDQMKEPTKPLAGPWFLTRDHWLANASEEYAKKRRLNNSPVAITYSTYLQMIAPFLSFEVCETEVKPLFAKLLRLRIEPISKEDVKSYVKYTLGPSALRLPEEALKEIVAQAHSSRTFRRSLLRSDGISAASELESIVGKIAENDSAVREANVSFQRLQSLITKGGSLPRDRILSIQKLYDDIFTKLRKMFKDPPANEMEVQAELNKLLMACEYAYDWSKRTIDYSTTFTIPDFIVTLNDIEVPIEVKFVDDEKTVPKIIEGISADQTKYRKNSLQSSLLSMIVEEQ